MVNGDFRNSFQEGHKAPLLMMNFAIELSGVRVAWGPVDGHRQSITPMIVWTQINVKADCNLANALTGGGEYGAAC